MKKKRKYKIWTEEDIKFLKDNYKNLSLIELSKDLDRTSTNIASKAKKLGLSKEKRWSIEDLEIIRHLVVDLRKEHIEVAKIMNTTHASIRGICSTYKISKKHGLSETKIYNIWDAMNQRCYNKNNQRYNNYGGKGVIVCEEWKNPVNFYNWSIENGYNENLSIDRIDNDGNYCPENCRWATIEQQMNNTSRNLFLTGFGKTQTLIQWSKDELCNVSYKCLQTRISKGMTIEEAICHISKKYNRKFKAYGEEKTLKEWANDKRSIGNLSRIKNRISLGWDVEKAISHPIRDKND